MVATPIGNLADVTVRALHVLSLVDAVACEDTRHTAQLLRHYGLGDKALVAVHEHNEREAAPQLVQRLARGQRVAYVSDAGTPAVSDPGARLVQAVREAGHRVVPVPGPSSAAAAVSVAGDDAGQGFRFVGFLPPRPRELEQAVAALCQDHSTLVLFEAPHRIDALARLLATHLPARRVTVCRELTKQFEEVVTLTAQALPDWLAADPHRHKGEFVLVLHAHAETAEDPLARAEPALRALVAALPLKQAVALAAQLTGAPRNALYERALQIKQGE